MTKTRLTLVAALSVTMLGAGGAVAATGQATSDQSAGGLAPYAEAFTKTDRNTAWTLTGRTRLDFETHHPQGFALVGDKIFMSSVEIIERPVKYPAPVDGYDRTTGKGVGHLFVMTRDGKLLKDIVLGEDTMYHPGGIDYDGQDVWVPVGEYRPNSRSIVYRVDAETLDVQEAFRYDDHVGGTVRDTESGRVHGVTWGSRRLVTWTPSGRRLDVTANPDHMLDYQDCAYTGDATQLCTGKTDLPTASGGVYDLGGLALTSLADDRVLHEVPFPRFSAAGHVVTRNPVALEQDGGTLRMFAAPDDGDEVAGTELLVYEASIPR